MTFDEAKMFVPDFDRSHEYHGMTLMEIARTDDGLLFLDTMAVQRLEGDVQHAIRTYVTEPDVADEIELAMERARSC